MMNYLQSRTRGLTGSLRGRQQVSILLAIVLFVCLAPFLADTYNTLNQRAFMDLMKSGNPFHLASTTLVRFGHGQWLLDWPYPPLTMLLILPAWTLYQVFPSEGLYQLVFKLPFLLSAIVTQQMLSRLADFHGLAPASRSAISLFVLTPVVVLLTTVAGGFDIVAAMLILAAYYFLTVRRSPVLGGLSLGLAGALRLYPIALVPIFLIHLAGRTGPRLREVGLFGVASIIPFPLTLFPFLLTDAQGMALVVGGQQMNLGPLASWNAGAPLACGMLRDSAQVQCTSALAVLFFAATFGAITAIYLRTMRRSSTLVADLLLVLLVFFLLYPKVHGLYLVVLIPLGVLAQSRGAALAWVPGVIWMLLFNGNFGATGLLYWAAPATGLWAPAVSWIDAGTSTVMLAGLQSLLLLATAISSLLGRRWLGPRGRGRTPRSIPTQWTIYLFISTS